MTLNLTTIALYLSSRLSKILESVIFNQLYEHFQTNNLFYKNQFGFRPMHSADLAALSLIDVLISQMDVG